MLPPHPSGGTHTAKIETNSLPTTLNKCPGQCLHHLVVHGAAVRRIGMADQGQAQAGAAQQQVFQVLHRLGACGPAQLHPQGIGSGYGLQLARLCSGHHCGRLGTVMALQALALPAVSGGRTLRLRASMNSRAVGGFSPGK